MVGGTSSLCLYFQVEGEDGWLILEVLIVKEVEWVVDSEC